MIGKLISHYKILEKLGQGGMGVVYKAEDTKLHRTVALKFLPPVFSFDKETKQRFINEAQTASSLQHNNICNIHDIDEMEDGQIFICMDFYEGETLKKKIERGPLKIDEAVNIGVQISEGLLKAHEKNIIHRDIKPANIFITNDGIVKILDFGLAKVSGQSQLTQMGSTVGTVAYMSPEQTKGEGVDQRTDIWSLGVVLYEMLTGKLPFKGDYEQAVIYSILNDKPEPTTGLPADIPKELGRVIFKALSKSTEERYQHIADMLLDLNKIKLTEESLENTKVPVHFKKKTHKIIYWTLGIVMLVALSIAIWTFLQQKYRYSEKNNFIAVLPFHPITNSEEDKSFAEGIHDDILTQLAKIRDLKVIARTSMLKYQETKKSIKEIADELGVGVVLEGSTRRIGNAIRISAQLIDAETEEHLWADSYDRQYADIFTIQSDVAQKIATALRIKLGNEEVRSIQTKPTENLKAWEYFKKGKYYWNFSRGYDGNLKAAEMFENACILDSNFALAYAWQAIVYTVIYSQTRNVDKTTSLNKYEKAILKANDLDPGIPEINIAKGKYLQLVKHDLNAALKEIETANIIRPNDIDILYQMSLLMSLKGDRENAIKIAIKVQELDPNGTLGADVASMNYFFLGKYNESEKWADVMIANKPESFSGYGRKIDVFLFLLGDLNRAEGLLEEAKKIITIDKSDLVYYDFFIAKFNREYNRALQINESRDDCPRFCERAILLKLIGRNEEAKTNFDSLRIKCLDLIKKKASSFDEHRYLAIAYAGLGDKTRALNEIAKHNGPYRLWWLTRCYMLMGDNNKAIQSLEVWFSDTHVIELGLMRFEPMYDPLRVDQRFKRLIQIAEERIREISNDK